MFIHINLSFDSQQEAQPFLRAMSDCTEGVPHEELARWEDDGGAPAPAPGTGPVQEVPEDYEELPAGVTRRIFFRDVFKEVKESQCPFGMRLDDKKPGYRSYRDIIICGPVTLRHDRANGANNRPEYKDEWVWIETKARLLVKE